MLKGQRVRRFFGVCVCIMAFLHIKCNCRVGRPGRVSYVYWLFGLDQTLTFFFNSPNNGGGGGPCAQPPPPPLSYTSAPTEYSMSQTESIEIW